MDFFIWINRRFGNPLEWTSSAKATLLLVVTLGMQLQYTLAALYVLRRPDHALLVHADFLRVELESFYLLMSSSALLAATIPLCRRLLGDTVAYEYVAATYYGLSHCYFAWLIGTLSLPVGIVLAGAPVLGFIFFHRGAVVVAFLASSLALLVLTLLSSAGVLPYAPMINGLVTPQGKLSLYWALSLIGYSVPHLLFLFGLAYLVLRRWREREDHARTLSRTDPLTGVYNRRSVLLHLDREQDRSAQQRLPMAVVMLDLDHFKQINDNWGHEAGDYVLIAAADMVQKNVRQNDRVGRYGGEEFLLVLPGADTEGARRLAERCRQQIERMEVLLSDGQRLRVSCSMGLYCNEQDLDAIPAEMLRRADKALYAAKTQGRNRVVVATADD